MDAKLIKELHIVEEKSKALDLQISELRNKKHDEMNEFLNHLPFQEGDKVKDKIGNIFLIEQLKEAFFIGKEEIKVKMIIRKIKKDGKPYSYPNEAWGIDYFSLEKVAD